MKLEPRLAKWEPLADPVAQGALERVLQSWAGTKYGLGQQCKGVATDCVRFVCGVLDELSGKQTPIHTLPPDTCFHAPELAIAGTHRIKSLYEPVEEISDGCVQPGDVVVTGPKEAGPSHAMIVGSRKNTVWHCASLGRRVGVTVTGLLGCYMMGHRVFMVYRLKNRTWGRAC